ncbi:Inactive rhomboid protein 1 [Lamellibrachia satsuma]|nr:Inactive rhomboid protein 1 [Lamellibrachia satsuma]
MLGGKVLSDTIAPAETYESVFDSMSQASSRPVTSMHIVDPLARGHVMRSVSVGRGPASYAVSRQASRLSTASTSRRSMRPCPQYHPHKESVSKIALDGIRSMWVPRRKTRKPCAHSRSFTPYSISSYAEEFMPITAVSWCLNPATLMCWVFTVHANHSSELVFEPCYTHVLGVHSSCQSQQYDQWISGRKAVVTVPLTINGFVTPETEYDYVDDVFFDNPPVSPPGSPPYTPSSTFFDAPSSLHPIAERSKLSEGESVGSQTPRLETFEPFPPSITPKPDEDETDGLLVEPPKMPVELPPVLPPVDQFHYDLRYTKSGWGVMPQQKEAPAPQLDDTDLSFEGMSRITHEVLDLAFDNSNRREIGKGIVGEFFNRTYRRDMINSDIKRQMKDIEQDDHRAYFTWWVTFVQVVVYIIAVSVYGLAPIGLSERLISAEVIQPNLAIEKVSYFERENLWIGPRQADLIHMGAKYSPCMRKDANVERILAEARSIESQTACCVRNDGSGCLQTIEDKCSKFLSTWVNRTEYSDQQGGYIDSGTVCGQDPKYCTKPLSTKPYEWSKNITQWPICHESDSASSTVKHMSCKLAGRPCCVGIHGQCIITTREYCQFRHGYFHEEANLCSQISCMNEICGMIPFANPARPDQFYRLWTSLFLHAGLLQLVITVLFQVFVMRDIEKLTGWLRIGIIYIGSGIAGSLSSAIFLPYLVEAGPAGSQFGILACLFTEVIQNYQIIRHPLKALGRLFLLLLFLFVIGLLPFVDNYAHLIGFVVGFLLSFALLPYLTFGTFDRRNKLIGIIVCLVITCGFFAMLVVLFYVSPIYNCPGCQFFNCLPLTEKFCQSMDIKTEMY